MKWILEEYNKDNKSKGGSQSAALQELTGLTGFQFMKGDINEKLLPETDP